MEVDVNLGEGERDAPFLEAIDPRIAGLRSQTWHAIGSSSS